MPEPNADVQSFTLTTPAQTLRFEAESQTLTLVDNATGQRLLFTSGAAPFCPVLEDRRVELALTAVEATAEEARLHYQGAGVEDFVLRITASPEEDCLDVSCEFTATEVTQLNRLELWPAETALNMVDLVNFRNRHHTPNTWPELLLGGAGCATDTFSRDWQFAPHPSLFLLRKLEATLFFGAYDLPVSTFGMYIVVEGYRVQTWHLDYGEAPWGMPLAAGERFASPRFRLFLREGLSVWEMLQTFSGMLIRGGQIPDPALHQREAWWREPLYCTWGDQCHAAASRPPEELQEQTAEVMGPTRKVMTEGLVHEAMSVIQRERLPFRIFLLDEGWHVARGQWEPHPVRFPNFRDLVDELHAQGFKVVIWWNWAEIDDDAEVNPAHLIGGGKRRPGGNRKRDYSLPATQEEYLKPLFHTFFSSDPGCYDLDGVKTDFLADKVHADMPVHDPAWRGEENYFVHVTELFYTEMKRIKPDAIHLACAGHFWLAQWQDLNRTYDVHCDYMIHEERARMLQATAPGVPVSYDFQLLENLDRWFASARDLSASVEIGNVLWVQDDYFSAPRPADAAYWALLRQWLGETPV
jgi:hypothetical protein